MKQVPVTNIVFLIFKWRRICNYSLFNKEKNMKGKMTIYYDEESDYMELYLEGGSPAYGEEVADDITLFRNETSGEIVGVGINNFKKRTKLLHELRLNLPFNVNFSAL